MEAESSQSGWRQEVTFSVFGMRFIEWSSLGGSGDIRTRMGFPCHKHSFFVFLFVLSDYLLHRKHLISKIRWCG